MVLIKKIHHYQKKEETSKKILPKHESESHKVIAIKKILPKHESESHKVIAIKKILPSHEPVLSYKLHKKTVKSKRIFIKAGLVLFVLASIAAYLSGYLSYVVDAYPIIKIGEHTTTLTCNYKNKKLTTNVKTYSNINNYYRYRESKKSILEDRKKLTVSNQYDNTIDTLSEDIKKIGKNNQLNEDQVIELATCFIQNIPYDETKASMVLGGKEVSDYDLSQFPYETLYKNSGICTDKTYLGSALISKLGYGTGLLLFPDAQHIALGIAVPDGYSDFDTKYAYIEMTQPGHVIGEVPPYISEKNGTAAISINNLADLNVNQDPSKINISKSGSISAPNLVIDVNEGNKFQRIVAIRQLENTILAGLDALIQKKSTIDTAYSTMNARDRAQSSAYSTYLSTPSTKLDCGYKYDYSYRYSYSYSSSSYSSPYKYSCDTISNPDKNFKYTLYSISYDSYTAQVRYYNTLIAAYNSSITTLKTQINNYKQYEYN